MLYNTVILTRPLNNLHAVHCEGAPSNACAGVALDNNDPLRDITNPKNKTCGVTAEDEGCCCQRYFWFTSDEFSWANIMTLTELRYIVTLSQEEHFGRAAIANVSQPTLSVAVKKLEEELGIALFERSKTRVSPTPMGNK